MQTETFTKLQAEPVSENTWSLLAGLSSVLKIAVPIIVAVLVSLYLDHLPQRDGHTFGRDEPLFFAHLHPMNLMEFFKILLPNRPWFYRPTFLIWFTTIWALTGRNPESYYFASIVLQAVDVCLLGYLSWILSKSYLCGLISMAVALCFQEFLWTVTWPAAASTQIEAVFILLSLIYWQRGNLTASAILLFVGMISKDEAIAFVPMLMISEYLRSRKFAYGYLIGALGYVILQGVSVYQMRHYGGWFTDSYNPRHDMLYVLYHTVRMGFGCYLNTAFGSQFISSVLVAIVLLTVAYKYNRAGDLSLTTLIVCAVACMAPSIYERGPDGWIWQYIYIPSMVACLVAPVLAFKLLNQKQWSTTLLALTFIGMVFSRAFVHILN